MSQESELIARAQAGDRAALGEIAAACWQPVYRLIAQKTGSPEDAQEITQETFFRAFRNLASFQRTDAKFSTYLGQIALNLVTDFWRRKGRTPPLADIADHQHHLAGGPDPGDQVVSQETRQHLSDALHTLPAEQRRVIELRVLAGLPVKDTAIALDKSEAAVKMLQQRALKNLRQCLQDRGVRENR